MAMDDLSDDGVSPPEWQSGSEREPEDDKEIEGNEPDEIPPSDPDSYVGLKEAENNGQWLQCIGKSVEKLPSYDGKLEQIALADARSTKTLESSRFQRTYHRYAILKRGNF